MKYLFILTIAYFLSSCRNNIEIASNSLVQSKEFPTLFSDTLKLKNDTICKLTTVINNKECICFKNNDYFIDFSFDTLNNIPCITQANFSQEIEIIYNNKIICQITSDKLIDNYLKLVELEKEIRLEDGLIVWVSSLEGQKNFIEVTFLTYFNTFIVGLFDYQGNLVWLGNDSKNKENSIESSKKEIIINQFDLIYKKTNYIPFYNCLLI